MLSSQHPGIEMISSIHKFAHVNLFFLECLLCFSCLWQSLAVDLLRCRAQAYIRVKLKCIRFDICSSKASSYEAIVYMLFI